MNEREALRRIAAIENKPDGGDWDEIGEARLIARAALASAPAATQPAAAEQPTIDQVHAALRAADLMLVRTVHGLQVLPALKDAVASQAPAGVEAAQQGQEDSERLDWLQLPENFSRVRLENARFYWWPKYGGGWRHAVTLSHAIDAARKSHPQEGRMP